MTVFQTIFDLIAIRSFSNLWYWIALAVTWSTASHWVLGVPYDMVLRARRRGGVAGEDLHDITRVNVRRIMGISREAGLVLAGLVPAILSFLAVTGFLYDSELAQAVFLLACPLCIVWLASLRLAKRLEPGLETGMPVELLIQVLARHRLTIQSVGLVAIVVTALWGMYQNLRYSVF
ncbi:component of SufBCD complex [Pseudothioclava arenosa]|uniref:Component of SufBCD complex n=1 Tax=Pseudothioclava arenosa TaxID=1795308 RepID=A0A2A4CS98_9RHOB|nr:component of SufBCD complex [Pseudothioclava arenosa]PCD76974.1 component of SufBCD complex [Pseudothioclava arenosa]